MIRDNTNLFQCIGPASQILILITAPPVKKKLTSTILYKDYALMNFHHDTPNSHISDNNFLEFLVRNLLIISHHG